MSHTFKVKRKDGKGWWTLPHMNQDQIDGLTLGEDTDLHKHDQMYYTETEIDAELTRYLLLDGTRSMSGELAISLVGGGEILKLDDADGASANDALAYLGFYYGGSNIVADMGFLDEGNDDLYIRNFSGLIRFTPNNVECIYMGNAFLQVFSNTTPYIETVDLTNTCKGRLSSSNTVSWVGSASNHDFQIHRNSIPEITISGSLVNIENTLSIAAGLAIDSILDQDDFYSDSDTALATQQSIKAYVDALDFSDYVRHDGTIPLSANWDVGAGNILYIDTIRSRLATDTGLTLANRGGTGYIYIDDGSFNVGINMIPGKILDIYSPTTNPIIRMEVGEAANCFIAFQDKDTTSDGKVYLGAVGDDMVIFADGYQALRMTTLGVLDVANSAIVLDEDTLGTDSATQLATQQSIKAYVDTHKSDTANPHSVDKSDLSLDTTDSVTFAQVTTGDTLLGDHGIKIDSLPDADDEWCGTYATMQVDANSIGFGGAMHCDTDGNLINADADLVTTMPCLFIALESGTGSKKVLLHGFVRNTAWSWTKGAILFVSTVVGTFTHTAPAGVGDQVQSIGIATATDTIFFNPSHVLVEIAA